MMENTVIKQEMDGITIQRLGGGGVTAVSQDVFGILEDFKAYEEINKKSATHMSPSVASIATEDYDNNKVIYAPSMAEGNNYKNPQLLSALLTEKPINQKYYILPKSRSLLKSTMNGNNGMNNNFLPTDTTLRQHNSAKLVKNQSSNYLSHLANDFQTVQKLSPTLLRVEGKNVNSKSQPKSKNKSVKFNSTNNGSRHKVQSNTKVRPNNIDQSSLLETFFQQAQNSNLVSQLQHIYFQNNIASSDEDDDVINEEANKLRMRNGLRPVDWRKIRPNIYQYPRAHRQTSSKESRNVVDSNPSSPSDVLVIDESPEETITDADSVISVGSSTRSTNSPIVLNKNLYSKRTRTDSDEECSRSSKEVKVGLSSSKRAKNTIVKYAVLENVGLARSSKSYLTDTATSTDSTTAVSCKTVQFQKIVNNIQNLKKESDDSITAKHTKGLTLKPDSQIKSALGTNESQYWGPEQSVRIKAGIKQNLKTNTLKVKPQSSQILNSDTVQNASNLKQTLNIESGKSNSSQQTKNNLADRFLNSDKAPANQSYNCVPCKLTFSAHLELKRHILGVHIRLFQCPKCDFKTLMPFKLQEHLQIHNGSDSSSGSLSPLRIKQLSSSSRSSTSSSNNSPIGIVEME